jgi:hypothetical protein
MNRLAKTLIAVGTAGVLCVGSFEAATAVASKPATVSVTQAINACATNGRSLRLPKPSGKCPSGTTKVALARPATAPRALALDTRGSQTKTLSLLDHTTLRALCGTADIDGVIEHHAELSVDREGKTQIDGTSFLVEDGGSAAFINNSGGDNTTPVGASSVYSATAGAFEANAGSVYATLNVHLLVTVPGAVFTIDGIIDVNDSAADYCRITADVESATT